MYNINFYERKEFLVLKKLHCCRFGSPKMLSWASSEGNRPMAAQSTWMSQAMLFQGHVFSAPRAAPGVFFMTNKHFIPSKSMACGVQLKYIFEEIKYIFYITKA